MTEKHHKAKLNYWSTLSKEQRSERMRHIATLKHSKQSPEERSAEASRISNKRWHPQMEDNGNLPPGYNDQ